MMHCSLVHGQHLLIGSYSKLFLVDLNDDFSILGQLHVCRHIFSICAANAFTVVCGQQGGQLAAVQIKDNQMVKVAENKVTSGIYKVVRTTQDDFALACSGGLYFAKLDPIKKKFTLQKDFLLADHLVTQVYEVSPNKFAVGCWGVPWVALVDKVKKTLIKIPCPLPDETQCTDLIPLPDFNLRSFPVLILRNSKALNLVNLSNLTMHRLLMRHN